MSDSVADLLKMFSRSHEHARPFYAVTTELGRVWFGCAYGDIPRKDVFNYSDTDVWVVLTRQVISRSGSLWGVRAIGLNPDKNVIYALGEANAQLHTFSGIRDITSAE